MLVLLSSFFFSPFVCFIVSKCVPRMRCRIFPPFPFLSFVLYYTRLCVWYEDEFSDICFFLDHQRRDFSLVWWMEKGISFVLFFGCRLHCSGTSMAVTEAQNPLIGENTCGSLLKKLQVTSFSYSSESLKMCMADRIMRLYYLYWM